MFDFSTQGTAVGVPAGAYAGAFEGYEPVPENPEKGFGPAYKFIWEIIEGPHAGAKATRIVSRPKVAPSPKNALGRMLVAMKGGTPTEGENLDPKQWVGRKYTVIVQATPKGGTRVETVAPLA